MPRYCSVVGCFNTGYRNRNCSLYRFPTNDFLCNIWVDFCNREDLRMEYAENDAAYMSMVHFICSDHFEPRLQYNLNDTRQGLRPRSIPTLRDPRNGGGGGDDSAGGSSGGGGGSSSGSVGGGGRESAIDTFLSAAVPFYHERVDLSTQFIAAVRAASTTVGSPSSSSAVASGSAPVAPGNRPAAYARAGAAAPPVEQRHPTNSNSNNGGRLMATATAALAGYITQQLRRISGHQQRAAEARAVGADIQAALMNRISVLAVLSGGGFDGLMAESLEEFRRHQRRAAEEDAAADDTLGALINRVTQAAANAARYPRRTPATGTTATTTVRRLLPGRRSAPRPRRYRR